MLNQQWRTKLRVLGYGVVLCASPALHAAAFPTEAMFEAEGNAPGAPWYEVPSGTDVVSGGKYLITPQASLPRVDAPNSTVELSYTIAVPSTRSYTIWLRVKAPNGAADSFHLAIDNAAYVAAFPSLQADTSKWFWFPVTQSLTAGERELKIKYREAGLGIDCLLVTALAPKDFVPQGYGAYPLPTVLPPARVHPRLFAREGDLADIRARFESGAPESEIKPHADKLLSLMAASAPVALAPLPAYVSGGPATTNHQIDVLTTIRAKALSYLLYPSAQAVRGKQAVQMMVDYLAAVQFSPGYNLANEKGEVVLTSAIVYDWCYSLMTAQQRSYFVTRFTEIAATMEIGFPPSRQGAVVGHGSEMQLMRDQLAAGIAFYDEAPLVYNATAGRFFADFIAPRNYAYASQAHHQGASYGLVRYMADMFASWIFKRMGAAPVFDPAQQMTPYHWLYTRRPDGQWMRDGDVYHSAYTKSTQYWSEPLAFLLPATYYNDSVLKHEYLNQPAGFIPAKDSLWPILFGNTGMGQGASSPALPLTKYFPDPAGLMISRTGWTDGMNVESGDVIATMKLGGDWFGNHEHYDAGHFQIYYKGGLAIDSGIYSGKDVADPTKSLEYGSPHDMNYHKRTIAHNSMLIYNPQEVFGTFANDGGQRMPGAEPQSLAAFTDNLNYKVASVLKHEFGPDSQTPDYSYIKGDLKPAYSSTKVNEFERSFVFLNLKETVHPAALIVFDKVSASNKNYKKTWLLHSQFEPEIVKDTITIKRVDKTYQYNGKLINRTLLPANATLTKVGGSGNEFSVAGKNYPIQPSRDYSTEEAGAWRVEVSPPYPSETDLFLNVMQVMDASTDSVLDTTAIASDLMAGVQIKDRVVLFAKSGATIDADVSFTLPAAPVRVLVTDLKEGSWSVSKNGTLVVGQYEVSAEAGTLYFSAADAGQYDLKRANVAPVALTTLTPP